MNNFYRNIQLSIDMIETIYHDNEEIKAMYYDLIRKQLKIVNETYGLNLPPIKKWTMKQYSQYILEDGVTKDPVYYNDLKKAMKAYNSLYDAYKDRLLADNIKIKKYNKKAYINYFHVVCEYGIIKTISLIETKVYRLS